MIWHAKHAKSREVWGHAPPENFEKLNHLRLNLRALLMVCYFYYSKTALMMHSAKQLIMYIWLNSTKPIARGSGGMPQKILKN